jgi:hypothetical protein
MQYDFSTYIPTEIVLEMSDPIESHWTPITNGLPTSGSFFSAEFGDVNNDGHMDVAASMSPGGMHVYVSDGAGNFVEESSGIPPGGNSYDTFMADVNNDGNLDVIGDGVYLGNGGVGGPMAWTFDSTVGFWWGASMSDMNLDGKLDIVAGTSSGIQVWMGDGGAGGSIVWTDSSSGLPIVGEYWKPAVGDINHDGKPDIVCTSRSVGIKAWTGNGLWGPAALWTDAFTGTGLPDTEGYASVDIGDVNHDGNLDIVTTAYYSGNGVRVWLGNGGAGGSMIWTENSAGLDTTSFNNLGVTLEDINNDGDQDILAARLSGGGLRVWLGDGGDGGTMDWTESSAGLPVGDYIDVAPGDYNNDGKVDFVVTLINGVEIWQNERPNFLIDTYISASINLPVANTWADVQFSDVDHDGDLDIGFTSFQGQNQGVRVYLGDGTGVWTSSSTGLPTSGDFSGLRFADIDHSGTIDIISTQDGGGGGNGIHAYSGDGAGSWTEMGLVAPESGAGMELADFNHDGNLDVVTGFWTNAWGPLVYLGNGDFTWSADVGPPGETINVDDVAVADVNHDGHLDFAASAMNPLGIQLWTGDGTGLPAGWTRNDTGLPTTNVWLGLDFADVNHDGNPDLVGTGFTAGWEGMHVWLGNGGVGGTMTWTPADTGLPATGRYGGVDFGDTNLDGNMDLIYASTLNVGATGIGYSRGNGGAGGSIIWSNPVVTGIPTTGRHWGVTFGDMDNDGIVDIAATSTSGVQVYKQGSPPLVAPQVTFSYPTGIQNWTGSAGHTIWWNMSDDSPNNNLVVYMNYSYNAGASTGTIVGPIAGSANPNSFIWTTPSIDATDVVINITVVDPGGLVDWDETFVSDIDSTLPNVLSTIPVNGASDVPIDQPLIIRFDDSMNTNSVASSISVVADPLGWIWSWSSITYPNDYVSGTHNPFNYGQSYSVTLPLTAVDSSSPGNPLQNVLSFSFTTEFPNAPPTVSVSQPTGGESWTGNTNHGISFVASDAEDPSSSLLVWLNYSLTGNPPWLPIAGPIAGDASPYLWSVPLVDITTAYIKADVVDTEGGVNSGTSASFEIDSTNPIVITTAPLNGIQNVPTNIILQATWSETMNIPITNMSFSLMDNATWNIVAGNMSWIGAISSFDPAFDLATASWYTANFTTTAADDSDPGNNLASLFSWSFRTALAPDTQPPKIENVTVDPSPSEVYSSVNISADIFDDFGVVGTRIKFTTPSGQVINSTLDSIGTRYYNVGSWDELGTYGYNISAVDSAGLRNWTTGQFQVMDLTPPTIVYLGHDPADPEEQDYVNISALVTDNYALSEVWIAIEDPNMQVSNYSMTPGTPHYFNQTYSPAGSYNVTIWAVDSSWNWASFNEIVLIQEIEEPTPLRGYIIISLPVEGQIIEGGAEIYVEGWVREIGTDRGLEGIQLTIQLRDLDSTPIGQEGFTVSMTSGRISATFIVPDEVEWDEDYDLRVSTNNTAILSSYTGVQTRPIVEPPVCLPLLIILIPVLIVVVVAILIYFDLMRKKKVEDEQESEPRSEDAEELPPEEPSPEESDDAQT